MFWKGFFCRVLKSPDSVVQNYKDIDVQSELFTQPQYLAFSKLKAFTNKYDSKLESFWEG